MASATQRPINARIRQVFYLKNRKTRAQWITQPDQIVAEVIYHISCCFLTHFDFRSALAYQGLPQSEQIISRFAPAAVHFWADSLVNYDLVVGCLCVRELVHENLSAGKPRSLRQSEVGNTANG